METVARIGFALAGLINALPVVGVSGVSRLEGLYGIPFEGSDLEILMRHRAVMLGIVGGLLLAAARWPSLRPPAAVAGFASMLSYLFLVAWVGEPNPELARVAGVDVFAVAALGLAFWAHVRSDRQR
ncbi:MAG: phosphopantetheine adenylyltransferase [Myxococcota bacterium]